MAKLPDDREKRFLPAEVCELRAEEDADKRPHIIGYAVVYGVRSQKMFFGREIIMPGAFAKSLKRGDDVIATVDHDNGKILGRRSVGTLKLRSDDRGLAVDIDAPDTTASRDVQESIRRRDVQGMSFEFRTITDKWRKEAGEEIREVHEADLFQVGPVTNPAYTQTDATVAMRSLEKWRAEQTKPTHIRVLRQRLDLAGLD